MILKKRIPKDFYKLFRTQNMDYYMLFLVALYEENSEAYTTLGLTIEEGQAIIYEVMVKTQIEWQEEAEEDEKEQQQESSQELQLAGYAPKDEIEAAPVISGAAPSVILKRLINWGWLKSDYDEKLNTYIISFPEYSQIYIELFQKLQSEDDSQERESILSIYSSLFTYHSDKEKNNDILKNALRTSKNLGQLLSNMQDGMRAYFDELSSRKNFIGIQEVLVDEINNSDSKKYAILTTTDSFYRYKEAVKDLISQILNENEQQKLELQRKQREYEKDSIPFLRSGQAIKYCEEAAVLVYQVEREFDLIERKYNKLIEQKAIFAKRALARIHYIFQEGINDEDNILKLIALLDTSSKKEQMLEELRDKITVTSQFRIFGDNSFYNRRENSENVFVPLAVEPQSDISETEITDFVPKPIYTKKQLAAFKQRNMQNGVFTATKDTVHSIEDLEKLLFLWQETTENQTDEDNVSLGEELVSKEGFTFSQLVIHEGEGTDA